MRMRICTAGEVWERDWYNGTSRDQKVNNMTMPAQQKWYLVAALTTSTSVMPLDRVDQLPMPSLHWYAAFSGLALSYATVYALTAQDGLFGTLFSDIWCIAVSIVGSIAWQGVGVIEDERTFFMPLWSTNIEHKYVVKTTTNYELKTRERSGREINFDFLYTSTQAILNMLCCCFFLLAKFVYSIVFGSLQRVEEQHMRDKFWNFVFYKFIFVFGVMNVQEMQEMLCWCVWFAVLGTLLLTEQLCKDRFQFVSQSH